MLQRLWVLTVLGYGLVVGSCAGYVMTEGPFAVIKRFGVMTQFAADNLSLRREVAELTAEVGALRAENHELDRHNTMVESERAEFRAAFHGQLTRNILLTVRLARLEGAVGAASTWCQGEIIYHTTQAPPLVLYDQNSFAEVDLSPQPLILRLPEPARIRAAYPE